MTEIQIAWLESVSYTHLDVYKRQVLETIITNIDIHTKERKSNGCGYKTEHVGLGLRGVSKEQLEKGDRAVSYTHLRKERLVFMEVFTETI